MKAKLVTGIFAGVLLCTSFAPADEYFVRNRPFKQVVKVGSEAYVPVESFLRVLGYNWTVKGDTVTLTTGAARNAEISAGTLNFKMNDRSEAFEVAPRGGSNYVSLRPLATFLGYNVATSPGGIVDVNKARFSTDTEKGIATDVAKEKEDRAKAVKDAWNLKAAEIKMKRENAAKDKAANDAAAAAASGNPAPPPPVENKPNEKKPATVAEKPKEEVKETPAPADASKDKKEKEAAPAPRLEVFSADAVADYSTGVITIKTQVKNQGNGPAKLVSGTLTLTGPDAKVWYSSHVRGPGLAPDAAWDYQTTYRHRDGSSMPHGTLKVALKLD